MCDANWDDKENVKMKTFKDIFKESKDAEYDNEGSMAKGQLQTIADAALELHDMLKDETNMPEWVQSKITKATDYIDTARDYMKTELQAEGRDYKKERENYLGTPKQMARNAARKRARRAAIKGGLATEGDGRDIHHKDNNPMNNDLSNLSSVTVKYNRTEPRRRDK